MNIDYKKIIRLFIGALTFLCITTIIGLTQRQAQQLFFSLAVMILFALIVKNIWLTLFVWFSSLLFTIFKFNSGGVYMTNIFYGTVLYYLTKLAFEKKHIDWFIKMVLWVVVVNLGYSILQILNYDFIYILSEQLRFTKIADTPSPNGFMGNSGITGILYCLAIPLIATRSRKSIWIAFLMLIPIFFLRAFTALMGGVVVLMFVLWFRVNKKIWLAILGILIILCVVYLMYFDLPGLERIRLWKFLLNDVNSHPIKGWGMDSFRKITELKHHIYTDNPNITHKPSLWDNPHNLYISLLFEFGFISLILLGGYIRQLVLWFKNSLKEPNTIALAGFILAFFVVSMGSFPIFLARMCVLIIPVFALYEISIS